MKIVISGGTGFIGRSLTRALLKKGHKVVVLARHPPKEEIDFYQIDLAKHPPPVDILKDANAIIHLAGKNLFGFWTKKFKEEIYNSRVVSAHNLARSISKISPKPSVFISASAVGYYGDKQEKKVFENSPCGSDFLAKVCVDWENATRSVQNLGIRTVIVRTASVLGEGGLLRVLLPIYKLGLAGQLGDGRQWFPWIHLADIVNIYLFAMESPNIRGPINAVSPELIRYQEFSDTLAKILNRPALFRIPKWLFKLFLDDLAQSVFASQKVIPAKLTKAGYQFAFPNLQGALEDILKISH